MDLVLTNAHIHTLDAATPAADTVGIEAGRIVFVGQRDDLQVPPGTTCMDLGGRTIVPGFIDSHTHPEMVTKSAWHIRLPWTNDVQEILDFVRDYAAAHPKEEAPFLYFEYYPSTLFAEGEPTKELLDTAVSDRPVLLQDFSEHASWVNSKMLELMEVTSDTPDPVPGLEMFARDSAGNPTGLLFEFVHLHFVDTMYRNLGWAPPEAITPDSLQVFLQFMARSGVTALFDALLQDEATLQALTELERQNQLHLYYEGAVRFRNRSDLPAAIAHAQRLNTDYGSPRIRVNALKLFLDGTNEIGNSAVLQPLCRGHQEPADLGEIQMEFDELRDCLELCSRAAIDVHIHMVGDRAFRIACDAVAAARATIEAAGETWATQVTFAHCELVDPEDMHRPAELGIIVNWTPHWSGAYFGEGAIAHLGEARWNRMYQFNQIAASGATLTFASDVTTRYEMERGAPLFGAQVAHTRVDPEYPLDLERYPESMRPEAAARLSRELLLRGYTINGAHQLRLDQVLGSIRVGKAANLNVLSADFFTVPATEIAAIQCDAVLFEGRLIAGSLPS